MAKFTFPSASGEFYELKIYNIQVKPSVSSPSIIDSVESLITIIAPDTYLAIQAFTYLHPDKDIFNVVCCGFCIALYPVSSNLSNLCEHE